MVTKLIGNNYWLRRPVTGSELPDLPSFSSSFQWLIAGSEFPELTATAVDESAIGWIASAAYLESHQLDAHTDNFRMAIALADQPVSVVTLGQQPIPLTPASLASTLSKQSSILAIVPHRDCNRWLETALLSLIRQTRPLETIAVIDDGSVEFPDQICRKYPQVTLLSSPGGVGPYQIVQSLVEATDFDAYLFQDADDWSEPERAERLLAAAIEYGAEIVGCQELRVDMLTEKFHPILYPLDVQSALSLAPGHGLLHPSSLVSRFAVESVGGFSNGLLFGGDTEFILRAFQQVRVINLPYFGYFRRKRHGSLTTSVTTGLDSPQRLNLLHEIKARAQIHQNCHQHNQPVDLQPFSRIPTVTLQHCCGPKI